MASIESVIEKIQKLRARAKSNNVHEAAACAAIADRLIQEHGLSEEQLRRAEGPVDDPDALVVWYRSTPAWQMRLAALLSLHYECASYILKGEAMVGDETVNAEAFHLVGVPDDIAAVRYMYTWLAVEIERLAQEARGRGTQANSFRHGAVVGVLKSMAASKHAAKESASDGAIVLYDRKLAEATAKMNEPGDIAGEREWHGATDPVSYLAGHHAGENLHYGKSIGDGHSALARLKQKEE